MPVQWRRRAVRDIVRIVQYIGADNPVAALRVARELTLAADSLTSFPYRGRQGSQPRTRELLAVYPYYIIYRIEPGQMVTVLRIWHGARYRR